MTLIEKILKSRPNLTIDDFMPDTGTIVLQDDSNGQGPYIKEWNHKSETQPTAEELE